MIKVGDVVKIDGTKIDKYKHVLAEVYTKNGMNVNLEMVRNGYAKTFMSEGHKNKMAYDDCQKCAKQSRSKIWSDSRFADPIDFSNKYTLIQK